VTGHRRAASAATSGETVPSARAGVHGWERTHSDAHPLHRNSGSPARSSPVACHSQTSWHGCVASGGPVGVTRPVCLGPR
jgi:hypothetical protein